MRRRVTEADYQPVHINVIPLIDVMMFLVLFFVATASFVKETGIDVNRPSARTASPQKKANIMVTVTKSGEVWVDRRKIDIRAVRPNVERLLVENPDSTVIVVADAETPARLMVQAIDQARLAGAPSVAIAASEAQGG